MKTKQHCWHFKEEVVVVTSFVPSPMTQVCCWCGASRKICRRLNEEGHGIYLPQPLWETHYTEPDKECIDREVPDVLEEDELQRESDR